MRNRNYTVLIQETVKTTKIAKGADMQVTVWVGETNLNEEGLKDLIAALEKAGVCEE